MLVATNGLDVSPFMMLLNRGRPSRLDHTETRYVDR
jgi:hypothetical protein